VEEEIFWVRMQLNTALVSDRSRCASSGDTSPRRAGGFARSRPSPDACHAGRPCRSLRRSRSRVGGGVTSTRSRVNGYGARVVAAPQSAAPLQAGTHSCYETGSGAASGARAVRGRHGKAAGGGSSLPRISSRTPEHVFIQSPA
jgi:hypothetical protein